MLGPLSYLDVALIALCLLSGLLAMYRGLSRELLSIVSWAVAGSAVLYFVLKQKQTAQDVAQQFHVQVPVAQVSIGALLFLIVLVIVHLITSKISDSILDSRVGMIDRMLGFLFGVVRGFILIVIPFMFYTWLYPTESSQFAWVKNARTRPIIESTGKSLQAILERYMPASLTQPSAPAANPNEPPPG